MRNWSIDEVSFTVSKFSVYYHDIILCFHLQYVVFCLTNVNVNVPLNHFYDFCKITVAKKACPVKCRFDISRS